jgi:hypothetical protein
VVGPAVCNYIREVLDGWSSVAEINQTFLVLIPKVAKPESVLQFRPISLCNVNFKILTKVIVSRLKPMIPNMASKHQSSFISGRHITDTIVVAQEIIHSMRSMKGKKGFMAIKVDLEKAYDCLRWDFIRTRC